MSSTFDTYVDSCGGEEGDEWSDATLAGALTLKLEDAKELNEIGRKMVLEKQKEPVQKTFKCTVDVAPLSDRKNFKGLSLFYKGAKTNLRYTLYRNDPAGSSGKSNFGEEKRAENIKKNCEHAGDERSQEYCVSELTQHLTKFMPNNGERVVHWDFDVSKNVRVSRIPDKPGKVELRTWSVKDGETITINTPQILMGFVLQELRGTPGPEMLDLIQRMRDLSAESYTGPQQVLRVFTPKSEG